MRLDVDFDPKPRRLGDQQAGRADATFAEMKVIADGDAADSEPLDEIVVNKFLRGRLGAPPVEGHHHGARKAGRRQKAELCGLVGEAELRGVRAEIAPRVGLECHCESRFAMRRAHAQRRVNDRTMAEMNAIEITHRHDHSLGGGGRGGVIADHGKFGGHLNLG